VTFDENLTQSCLSYGISVFCRSTQVNAPHSAPAWQAGTRFRIEGWKAELTSSGVWLCTKMVYLSTVSYQPHQPLHQDATNTELSLFLSVS